MLAFEFKLLLKLKSKQNGIDFKQQKKYVNLR